MLEANKRGDLDVLGLAFATNGAAFLVCIIAVAFLRRLYPQLYENNARSMDEGGLNTAPFIPEEHPLGWATSALQVTMDQLRVCVGVDEMLLIEFANFGMRLLFLIGVPLLCVLTPLHLAVGDNEVDKLSRMGMASLRHGSNIFWVHVCMVWYVVLVTELYVHKAMHRFLHVRVRWLLELEPPRSTTVLVEGIPESRRSDAELKAYFELLFPNCVESVYLVKNTRWLSKLVKKVETNRLRLEQAMFEWQQSGEDKSRRPVFFSNWFMRICGRFVHRNDKIEYYKEVLADLEAETDAERDRIVQASQEPMIEEQDASGRRVKRLSERAKAVNAHAGFVTFTSEREARLMLGMRCTASTEEWIPHVPPHHDDVIYTDMQVQLTHMKLSHLVGYCCVVGVFFSFLPLICGIGTLASFEGFKRHFHVCRRLQPEAGMIFEGVVASLALTTFTSFLPTILMLVFSSFFILRANAWAQLKLQTWLFWFNLIFVVLVTSLGGTLIGRLKEVAQSPLSILTVLAESLPNFTHFYLNYMLMQWVIHALNLTRYIQLIKYFIWRAVVGPDRAVVLTEPEDQDYYGIGSRSAQWTINLVIAIVFCTLCPLITVFTFINFFITRVVYGYLVVFAENRKPDLGGPFFVTQLWHVQYGLLVYAVLMVGVIWHHSNHHYLMTLVTVPTVFYVLLGFYRFYTNYQWEALPFEELCTPEAIQDFADQIDAYRALGSDRPCYRQEELLKNLMMSPASPKLEELQKQASRVVFQRRGSIPMEIASTMSSSSTANARRGARNAMHMNMIIGSQASGSSRAHALLDVGTDFVNRHFTEWSTGKGDEEGHKMARCHTMTEQPGSPSRSSRAVRRSRTSLGQRETPDWNSRRSQLSELLESGTLDSSSSSDDEGEGSAPRPMPSDGSDKGFQQYHSEVVPGNSWGSEEPWVDQPRRHSTS